jgi:tripartite-type tricarboxylate transporter receptor subunit TctC
MSAGTRACTAVLALAAALMLAVAPLRAAQPALRLVVAAAPGGGIDRMARLLAQRFEADLQRSVVVENRPGGGNRIALGEIVQANPGGDTLLVTTGASTIDLAFDANARPNIVDDATPVALVAASQLVFLVAAKSSMRSIADLVARARAAPGVLDYGSVNVQSTQRVAGELFKLATHTDIVQIPYRSEVANITALVAGDIDLAIVTLASSLPMIRAGEVRPLAVSSAARARALPQVPTLAEAGVAGVALESWCGLFAPRGTPEATVASLADAVQRAGASPEYRAALAAMGEEPRPGSPASFAAMLKAELARYREVIDTAHLRAQ